MGGGMTPCRPGRHVVSPWSGACSSMTSKDRALPGTSLGPPDLRGQRTNVTERRDLRPQRRRLHAQAPGFHCLAPLFTAPVCLQACRALLLPTGGGPFGLGCSWPVDRGSGVQWPPSDETVTRGVHALPPSPTLVSCALTPLANHCQGHRSVNTRRRRGNAAGNTLLSAVPGGEADRSHPCLPV